MDTQGPLAGLTVLTDWIKQVVSVPSMFTLGITPRVLLAAAVVGEAVLIDAYCTSAVPVIGLVTDTAPECAPFSSEIWTVSEPLLVVKELHL